MKHLALRHSIAAPTAPSATAHPPLLPRLDPDTCPQLSPPLPQMDVEGEVARLAEEVSRLGTPGPNGQVAVPFGVLFRETGDICACVWGMD